MSRASRRRDPTPELEALGEALRAMRSERGLKQIEVAHDAGVSEAQLSEVERGIVNPGWLLVTKIVTQGLGSDMTELAARYDPKTE